MIERLKSGVALTFIGLVIVAALLWLFAPQGKDADAIECRSHGGVYLWHKAECIGKQARLK